MIKRYALMFLGVALLVMALLLAISGVSLAWLTGFLGVGCVVMGIISVLSYKESPETEIEIAGAEDTNDDAEGTNDDAEVSIEDYRSRIAPDNIR